MLSAILFDLDGTLVNTDPLHYKVWHEILKDYGLKIDEKFYRTHMSGRLNSRIIRSILPHLLLEEVQQLAEEKEVRFRELATELKPMAGLSKILEWTEKRGLKRAVVTNAPRANAFSMLEVLGLTNAFDTIVLGEEAEFGKPHPAPYCLALHYLNITPESAIAFEDSPSGILSAVGAGIYTIGITSTRNSDTLSKVGAKMIVSDFNAKHLWKWLNCSLKVSSTLCK